MSLLDDYQNMDEASDDESSAADPGASRRKRADIERQIVMLDSDLKKTEREIEDMEQQRRKFKKEEERIKRFAGMLNQDLVFWFHEIEVLTKESDALPENLEVWLDFIRLLFLVKMGVVKKGNLDQNQQKLFGKAESIPASKLKSLLFSFDKKTG